eukprot:2579973-Alexandrium_andersonii.AAC.1
MLGDVLPGHSQHTMLLVPTKQRAPPGFERQTSDFSGLEVQMHLHGDCLERPNPTQCWPSI